MAIVSDTSNVARNGAGIYLAIHIQVSSWQIFAYGLCVILKSIKGCAGSIDLGFSVCSSRNPVEVVVAPVAGLLV